MSFFLDMSLSTFCLVAAGLSLVLGHTLALAMEHCTK